MALYQINCIPLSPTPSWQNKTFHPLEFYKGILIILTRNPWGGSRGKMGNVLPLFSLVGVAGGKFYFNKFLNQILWLPDIFHGWGRTPPPPPPARWGDYSPLAITVIVLVDYFETWIYMAYKKNHVKYSSKMFMVRATKKV